MAGLFYSAAWTDSGRLSGCDHQHLTVVAAVVCGQSACAGAYVVAVEDGAHRELNERENREFELAMYGTGVGCERIRALRTVSLRKLILS